MVGLHREFPSVILTFKRTFPILFSSMFPSMFKEIWNNSPFSDEIRHIISQLGDNTTFEGDFILARLSSVYNLSRNFLLRSSLFKRGEYNHVIPFENTTEIRKFVFITHCLSIQLRAFGVYFQSGMWILSPVICIWNGYVEAAFQIVIGDPI